MQYSLYLHIPFCRHRCAYCDFNTYAANEGMIPAYVAALCREAELVGAEAPDHLDVHTIFFGGGTPSLLSASQLKAILTAIRGAFHVYDDAEITLEANPGTVSLPNLEAMRELGINRISLGVQSANGFELRMLEREHSFLDVLQAVSAARRAGFSNLNVDLIYGLPEQSLAGWQTTIKRTLDLQPEHISAYALTLEHGTPFGRWSARGLLPTPNPDLAADMYEWLSEELMSARYRQYEISNWTRNGQACIHNLQYWRALPYLGLGAGAHGYAGGYRYSNVLRTKTFIERLGVSADGHPRMGAGGSPRNAGVNAGPPKFPFSPALLDYHHQTDMDEMSEFMITGLRLTSEGINATAFQQRFGRDLIHQYAVELAELAQFGLLEWAAHENAAAGPPATMQDAEVVRLTSRGRLLANQVFMRFLN